MWCNFKILFSLFLFLSLVLFRIRSTDRYVQNHFVWLDDKTITWIFSSFFIPTWKYVVFYDREGGISYRSRENFYYWFLLALRSRETQSLDEVHQILPLSCSLCSCLDWLCGVRNWIAITGKPAEDRLCQNLASLQSLFIPFRVDLLLGRWPRWCTN